MAFPEDEYTQHTTAPSDGPITTWGNGPLLTLFGLAASGVILLVEWGIAVAFLPLLLPYMPETGPVDTIGLVIMILFVPIGAIQLYIASRLYGRKPNSLNLSFVSALLVIVLTIIIIVTGLMTETLTGFELPAIQIGLNLVIAYLSRLADVRDHFES